MVFVMVLNNDVLFGYGLGVGVDQTTQMLREATLADDLGLDILAISDHPYFGDRVDAYAQLAFVLGRTQKIAAAAIVTNLFTRPAPILARTLAGLSELSGGRIAIGLGSGGMEEEMAAFGVPYVSPRDRVRALEESVTVIRELTGGGDPVTFDGDFFPVKDLAPSAAPTPPIWVGVGGPKGYTVVGKYADGWIPPHAADWRSARVGEGRPLIDEAAVAAGRSPADIGTIYLVAGSITQQAVSENRNDKGRWHAGSVDQWVEELTFAVTERQASAFIYLAPPGMSISEEEIELWANEIAPAVREATSND